MAGYLARPVVPDSVASCRVESLLHAPGPLVPGPVDTAAGPACWEGSGRLLSMRRPAPSPRARP